MLTVELYHLVELIECHAGIFVLLFGAVHIGLLVSNRIRGERIRSLKRQIQAAQTDRAAAEQARDEVRVLRGELETSNQAVLALRPQNLRLSKEHELLGTLRHRLAQSECELRHLSLFCKHERVTTHNAQDAMRHALQFFEHQCIQWGDWKKGLISDETWWRWMSARESEWMRNESRGGITYREAFHKIAPDHLDPNFARFLQRVYNQGVSAAIRNEREDQEHVAV